MSNAISRDAQKPQMEDGASYYLYIEKDPCAARSGTWGLKKPYCKIRLRKVSEFFLFHHSDDRYGTA